MGRAIAICRWEGEAPAEPSRSARQEPRPPETWYLPLQIALVASIMVLVVIATAAAQPAIWLQMSIYLPFTFISSLLLLQPVKGAVVGFQWAMRMHGFDENAPGEIPPV